MSRINRHTLKLIQQFVPVVVMLFITAGFAISQSYFHSPNDTLISNTTVNNSVTMNITQVHPNNDTLQFVWKKFEVSMPNDWTATICDNNTCFPSLIDSSTTLPVLPGDDGLMLVHCFPNTNAGTGIIRYTIYEIHNPFQVDTLTWIINASSALGTNESGSQNMHYKINGNQFQLTSSDATFSNFALLDLSGKEIFSSSVSASNCIEIPAIPSAFYYLVLSGTKSIIRQKIWYSTN